MWQIIKERLKSKVVWGQIVVAVFALIASFTGKDYTHAQDVAQTVVGAIFAVYSLFSAMNNPTDKMSF